MPKPVEKDIDMYEGDDRTYRFYVKDKVTGEPLNYAGSTGVTFRVASSYSGSNLFSVSLTDSSGGNDWAKGIFVVAVTAVQSALVTSNAYYDLSLTTSGSKVNTLVRGRVLATRDVP